MRFFNFELVQFGIASNRLPFAGLRFFHSSTDVSSLCVKLIIELLGAKTSSRATPIGIGEYTYRCRGFKVETMARTRVDYQVVSKLGNSTCVGISLTDAIDAASRTSHIIFYLVWATAQSGDTKVIVVYNDNRRGPRVQRLH